MAEGKASYCSFFFLGTIATIKHLHSHVSPAGEKPQVLIAQERKLPLSTHSFPQNVGKYSLNISNKKKKEKYQSDCATSIQHLAMYTLCRVSDLIQHMYFSAGDFFSCPSSTLHHYKAPVPASLSNLKNTCIG